MLTTEDLVIGYHKTPLIRQIELVLKEGQILALIGPNGSGKSTLLKTLSGLLKPVGGTVCLDGEELNRIPGKQLAQKMSVMVTERRDTGYATCYVRNRCGNDRALGKRVGEFFLELVEASLGHVLNFHIFL